MAKNQYGFKAEKTKKEPKLLCKNIFTVGNELREAPVPETMVNQEGKTVPYVPKYRESIVVSLVDKVMWFYEKVTGYSKEINYNLGKAAIYVFLFLNS